MRTVVCIDETVPPHRAWRIRHPQVVPVHRIGVGDVVQMFHQVFVQVDAVPLLDGEDLSLLEVEMKQLLPIEHQQLVEHQQHTVQVHKIVLELLFRLAKTDLVRFDIPLALGLVKQVVTVKVPVLSVQAFQGCRVRFLVRFHPDERRVARVLFQGTWRKLACPSATEWLPQLMLLPICRKIAVPHPAWEW